jgi:hypothetical protein
MIATTYNTDYTDLLIVDPYNDFMSEYKAAVGFYDNMRKPNRTQMVTGIPSNLRAAIV